MVRPVTRPPESRVNSTMVRPRNVSPWEGTAVHGVAVRVRKVNAVSVAETVYVAPSSSLVYVPA